MEVVGQVIVSIMMAFVLIGAGALIIRPSSELGREFKEGILSIGHIFIPIAGVMVMIPLLTQFISTVIAPAYAWLHADPALAAGTFIAGDLGAYQLAHATAGSHGAWIMAFAASFTAGWTIIFGIPVGLAMIQRRDHKYLALGVMAGLLSVPFAVFAISLILSASGVLLREDINTSGPGTSPFDLPIGEILVNLVPLAIIMVVIALALRFFTNGTIKVFLAFGRGLEIVTTIAVAVSIVEYFTGVFSTVFGGWPLDPFIADEEDTFRALEVAGVIGVMLAGAFPMVYAIRRLLAKPLGRAGKRIGVSEQGMSGFLAASANVLALYRLVALMPPKDKVLTIAFAVCGSFVIGDHLAFTANFQPGMIVAMSVGKLIGAVIAVFLALWLAVPHVRTLEALDRENGVIAPGEYGAPVEGIAAQDPAPPAETATANASPAPEAAR